VLSERARAFGSGCANMHDVRHPAFVDLGCDLSHTHVLGVVDHDRLARASSDPEAVHTGLDVVLHDLSESSVVYIATCIHRRDDRRHDPREPPILGSDRHAGRCNRAKTVSTAVYAGARLWCVRRPRITLRMLPTS
jgi:hypothetical protein